MLFPDPSCIANETILKLKERGIYRLIGADWVAIATISFRGAIYLDAWEDLNGVDGQIPRNFWKTTNTGSVTVSRWRMCSIGASTFL